MVKNSKILGATSGEELPVRERPLSTPPATLRDELLARYFYDLHGLFMKRVSAFAMESEYSSKESVRLQAMLEELVKVKKLMTKSSAKCQNDGHK